MKHEYIPVHVCKINAYIKSFHVINAPVQPDIIEELVALVLQQRPPQRQLALGHKGPHLPPPDAFTKGRAPSGIRNGTGGDGWAAAGLGLPPLRLSTSRFHGGFRPGGRAVTPRCPSSLVSAGTCATFGAPGEAVVTPAHFGREGVPHLEEEAGRKGAGVERPAERAPKLAADGEAALDPLFLQKACMRPN